MDCAHYLFVYAATDTDQLLQLSLEPDSSCDVTQLSYDPDHMTPCDPWWYAYPISNCNVTGLWQRYDRFLSNNCERPGYVTDRVLSKKVDTFYQENLLFSNVFCAICNLDEILYTGLLHQQASDIDMMKIFHFFKVIWKDGHPDELFQKRPRLPFSLLLGLREAKLIRENYSPNVKRTLLTA